MSLTPFMALTLPTVSVTLGPEWATELNAAFEVVDSHDHTSGKGKPIPVSALLVNSNFDTLGFRIESLLSTQYNSQSSPLAGASNASSVYVVAGDLWYTNASGVAVQITAGGSVVSVPASLNSLRYDEFNADLIIGAADPFVVISMDTTVMRTVTLPLASSVAQGRIYIVKDQSGLTETNPLMLAVSGADTIDSLSTITLDSNFGTWFVTGNGVNSWRIL